MSGIERLRLTGQLAEPLSHYTDAVITNDLLWISGLLSMDADGNLVGEDNVATQMEQICKNMKAVLEYAGANFSNVIKVVVYLRDIDHREMINPIREQYFGEYRPVSTLIEISKLAHPKALIEVEAVAYLGNK